MPASSVDPGSAVRFGHFGFHFFYNVVPAGIGQKIKILQGASHAGKMAMPFNESWHNKSALCINGSGIIADQALKFFWGPVSVVAAVAVTLALVGL